MLAIPSFIIYFVSFLFVFFYNYKISNIYSFIPFRSVRVQYYFNWNASKMKIPSLDTRSWVWKIGLIFGLFLFEIAMQKNYFFQKMKKKFKKIQLLVVRNRFDPLLSVNFMMQLWSILPEMCGYAPHVSSTKTKYIRNMSIR